MLLAKFVKIRCMRKISVLQYFSYPSPVSVLPSPPCNGPN